MATSMAIAISGIEVIAVTRKPLYIAPMTLVALLPLLPSLTKYVPRMLVRMQAPPMSSGSAIIDNSKSSPTPLSRSAVSTMVAPTVTT